MKSFQHAGGRSSIDLEQGRVQAVCSKASEGMPSSKAVAACLGAFEAHKVEFPGDGRSMGNWRVDMKRYARGKVHNPQAHTARSHMPRFGDGDILTEDPFRRVLALLMHPDSSVRQ